jgi:circadian clock protein KaiC
MDTWLLLRNIESDRERNRGLYVLKSRGMAHSNQVREFLISARGIDLVDAYAGPGGVLVGSARSAQTVRDKAAAMAGQQEARCTDGQAFTHTLGHAIGASAHGNGRLRRR